MAGDGKCIVDGCNRTATRTKKTYCEKHYYRLRRTGTTADRVVESTKHEIISNDGYVLVHAPEHPLSEFTGSTRVRKHRIVLYDAIGGGKHACHWCGGEVDWKTMHVDHVNGSKADNRIENLVPSCAQCNMQRGLSKMRQTLLDKRGIEFNGQKKSRADWAKDLGISVASLNSRLRNNWSLERALTEPRGVSGPRS